MTFYLDESYEKFEQCNFDVSDLQSSVLRSKLDRHRSLSALY